MKNKTLLSASLVLMMAMPAATASAQGTLEDYNRAYALRHQFSADSVSCTFISTMTLPAASVNGWYPNSFNQSVMYSALFCSLPVGAGICTSLISSSSISAAFMIYLRLPFFFLPPCAFSILMLLPLIFALDIAFNTLSACFAGTSTKV